MSESRFQELSSAVVQNPCAIIITDLEGNIQYVNEKFCQMPKGARGLFPCLFNTGQTVT